MIIGLSSSLSKDSFSLPWDTLNMNDHRQTSSWHHLLQSLIIIPLLYNTWTFRGNYWNIYFYFIMHLIITIPIEPLKIIIVNTGCNLYLSAVISTCLKSKTLTPLERYSVNAQTKTPQSGPLCCCHTVSIWLLLSFHTMLDFAPLVSFYSSSNKHFVRNVMPFVAIFHAIR